VTEQLPPDVIAQLTGMDPAVTPELVAASWALLKPFHDKAGYTAPKVRPRPSPTATTTGTAWTCTPAAPKAAKAAMAAVRAGWRLRRR